ncbi:unnamed protein product [Didymodactylos carnosus]|uniref:FAM86 N-terminal domain-containing protein n=1 Tax=Didymodactylos carnosus TaxID=1234261 RepID=A0A813QG89_9BILA|nr:unnamed protein product [Didymodactylos carnosus]CAF3548162.1 unnamed protein product [Didymodactylos carnosus]
MHMTNLSLPSSASETAVYGRGLKITDDMLEKWREQFINNDTEFQKFLLEQTFSNPIFEHCCLRIIYQKSFAKTFLKWAEKCNMEIDDQWFEIISKLMANDCEQDWNHTDNNQTVIIRQTTALLSQGNTGLSIWPSAIYLANYLMKNGYLLRNKQILELGSGVGILGLSLLKYIIDIRTFVFSDYSDHVLNLLRQNLSINFPQLDCCANNEWTIRSENDHTKVQIEELDWNQYDKLTTDLYDLIIASDVIYDPSIIESLIKTLKKLLINNSSCIVFMANVIRNESTYALFRQKLEESTEQAFVIERIIDNNNDDMTKHSVEILKIHSQKDIITQQF